MSLDKTRRVRRDQQAAWFPLFVLALVTFAAIPFDRYAGHHLVKHCTSAQVGHLVCTAYSPGEIWYWLAALLVAYAVIAMFYLRRSTERGVGTRVQPYVVTGLILLALAIAWSVWAVANPGYFAEHLHVAGATPTGVFNRLASPAGAIGLALIVLAWIERSVLLAAVTAVYLALVVTAAGRHARFSRIPFHPQVAPWGFLPHVLILGGVLLAGSVVLRLSPPGQAHVAA